MARRRFLPKYVTSFQDRHGKTRYRFRRAGYEAGYFKAELGTDEFRQEYSAFLNGKVEEGPIRKGVAANSVEDLVRRYMTVPKRLGPSKVTQEKVRSILERFVVRYGAGEHGPRYVDDFTFEHIDKILEREQEKRPEGKRMIGGLEAARKLRKELVRLFEFAEKVGIRPLGSNPVKRSEKIAQSKTGGHHSWSEDEIAQYRATHKLGTSARLALELLLWTGQRRGDGYQFSRSDVIDGRFEFEQQKGGKKMRLPLAPQLVAAITAMPKSGHDVYLLNDLGQPFSYAGFGNKMREWCDAAGLPHCSAHGLRKATARRLAELDMSNATLKAVGGWSEDKEVALYVAAADQERLAATAISALSKWEEGKLSNPERLTKIDWDGNAL